MSNLKPGHIPGGSGHGEAGQGGSGRRRSIRPQEQTVFPSGNRRKLSRMYFRKHEQTKLYVSVEFKTRTYHRRDGAGRRTTGRRCGVSRVGSGRRRDGSPRRRSSPLPSRASKASKTVIMNVFLESRTNELQCKSLEDLSIPKPGHTTGGLERGGAGRGVAGRSGARRSRLGNRRVCSPRKQPFFSLQEIVDNCSG